jgi:signal transduction histidine kinase
MRKLSQFFRHWYMRFFRWILSPEHRGHSVMEFKVHMLLVVVFVTGILMWAYALLADNYINHPSIKYTGYAYAFIHLCSPLVYKYTRSITAATYTMLIPGGIFQTHFALLTGGFFTTTIVWVGILPLIAGILTDKTHTVVWGIFSMLAIIATFSLTMMGLTGDYFVAQGRTIAQFQVTFGMILLNSAFTIFLLILTSKYEEVQKRRKIAFQNLLRIMVHDIANPLTVIINMAKGLPFVKGDPNQENYFQNQIISQSTKMANIIESVRWMEGLESGKKAPKIQAVPLAYVVSSCLKNVQEQAKMKNIQIDADIAGDVQVLGHPTVIENQVLTNILTNCLKFSPQNSRLSIKMGNQDTDSAELLIIDQGIGIPANILENIFDPFYPTSRRGTDGEEGTGFGMPIALKSMEFFKGTITIATKDIETYPEDHGTTFTLHFKK